MKWNHALDKTLRMYGISAKWLSSESKVSENMISQFRKGRKDATTETLDKLLQPLPFEAKEEFFSLVLGQQLPPAKLPALEDQLQNLSREDKKKMIMSLVEAIATEEPSEKRSLQKV